MPHDTEGKREEILELLLSEGLDLCVRARSMDEMDRREAALKASSDGKAWQESGQFDRYVARHNIEYPDQQISTRSMTVPIWLNDQYEKDLAEWERRARLYLIHGVLPS